MAYGRSFAIPGQNVALFRLGVGEGEGDGADRARPRGSRFGMTRLGGFRALMSGPWIETGGAGSESGVPSVRPWVEGRMLVCDRLGVEAEELMVLLG